MRICRYDGSGPLPSPHADGTSRKQTPTPRHPPAHRPAVAPLPSRVPRTSTPQATYVRLLFHHRRRDPPPACSICIGEFATPRNSGSGASDLLTSPPVAVAARLHRPGCMCGFPISTNGGPFKELAYGGCVWNLCKQGTGVYMQNLYEFNFLRPCSSMAASRLS